MGIPYVATTQEEPPTTIIFSEMWNDIEFEVLLECQCQCFCELKRNCKSSTCHGTDKAAFFSVWPSFWSHLRASTNASAFVCEKRESSKPRIHPPTIFQLCVLALGGLWPLSYCTAAQSAVAAERWAAIVSAGNPLTAIRSKALIFFLLLAVW